MNTMVVSPSTASIAIAGFFGLAGDTPQMSPYTMRRTFNSARVPNSSATRPTMNAVTPREPREVRGAADGLGDEAADAGLPRRVTGILVHRLGCQPEPDHRDEHVGHEEEEHPEGHRAREHDAARRDVALERAEPGVDQRGVGARPLEAFARVHDSLREPRLLRLEAVGGAGDATGISLVVGRFPRGLHRATVDQV